ncbi:Coiled-coil domain-containing protein 77 [Clonorchis sinensis]|uniref:Coiled-coil domain-containing protein 77 n=1 Tax=Clonorchis sinensis TaxID=79923 RepID=A0A8T1ML86_CLOSI|nr:Coiled-coil domain-containing protein 77 [Clonorchis sinensis]
MALFIWHIHQLLIHERLHPINSILYFLFYRYYGCAMYPSMKPSAQCSTHWCQVEASDTTVKRSVPENKKGSHQQNLLKSHPVSPVLNELGIISDDAGPINIPTVRLSSASGDGEELLQLRLDQIATAIDKQKQFNLEIREREREISELKTALSDLRLCLLQEREHVLTLYAENDQMKIREINNKRKIQQLLRLSSLSPDSHLFFLREYGGPAGDTGGKQEKLVDLLINLPKPKEGVVEFTPSGETVRKPNASGLINFQRRNASSHAVLCTNSPVSELEHEAVVGEIDSTKDNFWSLRTQLTEQTRLVKEQLSSLLDDRRAILEDAKNTKKQYDEKLRLAQEQLTHLQTLLHDSASDFLAQRKQFRLAEKAWKAERDKLLSQFHTNMSVSALKNIIHERFSCVSDVGVHHGSPHFLRSKQLTPVTRRENRELCTLAGVFNSSTGEIQGGTSASLEDQLRAQQKLSAKYHERILELEEELVRSREEAATLKDTMKQQSEKLTQRLRLMSNRCRELERRRLFEMQGHRTDIEMLRKKLKGMEKQLLQLSLDDCNNDGHSAMPSQDMDIFFLRQVRASTAKSTRLMGELKNLKLKMYTLEDEVRKM